MKYLRLSSNDPYLNLAIEEYLLENEKDDVIMLWQNSPSVVVGKNQNIRAEVDTAALIRFGVRPVRRISGGGAVYHDSGNINYTFITGTHTGGIDFATLSRPMVDALASIGISVSLSGRNDLCLADGRKVSGNAQCKRGERVLHHGTLLFDADLSMLEKLLTPDEEKLKTKAVKSTRARVANLKELLPELDSAEELIKLIENYIITTFSPQIIAEPSNPEVARLKTRNSSDEWLYPTSGVGAKCTLRTKKRYPFGSVELEASFIGEAICAIRIGGDFFGERDVSLLEDMIVGKTVAEIDATLCDDDITKHINGMSKSELISLINNEH